MITKIELEDFRANAEYIKSEKERINELLEQTQKVTSTLSDMPRGTSTVQDKMAETLAKIMDMQNDILKNIMNQEQRLIYIQNEIDKLEPKYRNIIYKHYILGKELVVISAEEHYGYEWTCRLHGIALQKLKEVI